MTLKLARGHAQRADVEIGGLCGSGERVQGSGGDRQCFLKIQRMTTRESFRPNGETLLPSILRWICPSSFYCSDKYLFLWTDSPNLLKCASVSSRDGSEGKEHVLQADT